MIDKTKVLIADDHALFRAGLRQLIEDTEDFTVVGEAAAGDEALRFVRENAVDIVLLDISMPRQGGMDVMKRLRIQQPTLGILIVSMYPEDQYAVNMLRAGASGYLSKDATPDAVLSALRTVRGGKKYISADVAALLAESPDASSAPLHSGLSQREFQIFFKLASGRSVSDVAGELFLSVKTVSTYRSRVLEKMGMQSNADLTYYAIKNGLIQ